MSSPLVFIATSVDDNLLNTRYDDTTLDALDRDNDAVENPFGMSIQTCLSKSEVESLDIDIKATIAALSAQPCFWNDTRNTALYQGITKDWKTSYQRSVEGLANLSRQVHYTLGGSTMAREGIRKLEPGEILQMRTETLASDRYEALVNMWTVIVDPLMPSPDQKYSKLSVKTWFQ